jgi:nicotinamidase-related amidase
MGAISVVFPGQEPNDRVSTNAWADIKPAVEATGRRVLVMAGLWTEVCLAETALSAIKDGYSVYFVSDCSGGVSRSSRGWQAAHGSGRRQRAQPGLCLL